MDNLNGEDGGHKSLLTLPKFKNSIMAIAMSIMTLFFIAPNMGIGALAITVIIFAVFAWLVIAENERLLINKKLIENKARLSEIKIPLNIPFPYAIIGNDMWIMFYNQGFKDIFDYDIDNLSIKDIIKEYNENEYKQIIEIEDKYYELYSSRCDIIGNDIENHNGAVYSVCLVDVTENEMLKKRIDEVKTVVGLVFIDNYEEVIESIEEASVPLLTALIDRKLNSFAAKTEGVVKKFEKDRYMFVLSRESLEVIKEKKFEILNEVKEINIGEHIPVTLSMGIGIAAESLDRAMKNARAAIDLALGRGGDQVLIKEGDKYLFYGGKSGEVSHNARIRARVKADAFSEIICESTQVFVMGHKQADLDSLGSSIGIYRIAKTLGKNCYIVLDTVSVGIKRLYERLMETDEYENVFISCEESIEMMTDKTLVVITDTHRHSMVACSELLEASKRVVVFDHHRKSTDFIDKAVLIYHEPYASSTSELITEMIQYIGEKIRLKPVEADALLGGITVDTKNFCLKTGAITFEAAAYLKRNGADGIRVRLLFQNDMAAYKAKASAVKDAEIFMESIAISECPSNVENSSLTAAQAADELLNVMGIKASFVLCIVGDTVYVSARSLGEINVQVILEKLGGGGHQTMSGVQFVNQSLNESKNKIKEAIKQYLQEEN